MRRGRLRGDVLGADSLSLSLDEVSDVDSVAEVSVEESVEDSLEDSLASESLLEWLMEWRGEREELRRSLAALRTSRRDLVRTGLWRLGLLEPQLDFGTSRRLALAAAAGASLLSDLLSLSAAALFSAAAVTLASAAGVVSASLELSDDPPVAPRCPAFKSPTFNGDFRKSLLIKLFFPACSADVLDPSGFGTGGGFAASPVVATSALVLDADGERGLSVLVLEADGERGGASDRDDEDPDFDLRLVMSFDVEESLFPMGGFPVTPLKELERETTGDFVLGVSGRFLIESDRDTIGDLVEAALSERFLIDSDLDTPGDFDAGLSEVDFTESDRDNGVDLLAALSVTFFPDSDRETEDDFNFGLSIFLDESERETDEDFVNELSDRFFVEPDRDTIGDLLAGLSVKLLFEFVRVTDGDFLITFLVESDLERTGDLFSPVDSLEVVTSLEVAVSTGLDGSANLVGSLVDVSVEGFVTGNLFVLLFSSLLGNGLELVEVVTLGGSGFGTSDLRDKVLGGTGLVVSVFGVSVLAGSVGSDSGLLLETEGSRSR